MRHSRFRHRGLRAIAGVLFFGACGFAEAQAPPATEVYLVEVARSQDGAFLFGAPKNISRRPGYDNQPSFWPDGESLVYTAIDTAGQADIYRYDLAAGQAQRLTDTPESEYSPTPIPGEAAFSVVRVESDGTQRLWKFPLSGDAPELLLPEVAPVGYHAWATPDELALFILGDPPTLEKARPGNQASRLRQNIGRALARVPDSTDVSFVQKGDGRASIVRIDLRTGHSTPLAKVLSGGEDYAWSPDGGLWMADGGRLYHTRPGEAWRLAADFTGFGLRGLTRLAFHPRGTHLAMVGVESGSEAIVSAEHGAAVDEIFSAWDRGDQPGCAVGVMHRGELVHAAGYGMAHLEHGIPIHPATIFRIGSTSKQFTAFAVQMLTERGKVDLDADLTTYFPELPDYGSPVTTRHLIHHTSGIRDYLDLVELAGLRQDDYFTDPQVLDLIFRQRQLNFPPGERFLYSNSGYFLLGQLVARVSGKSLRQFAADEIFTPLGMASTHFHDDHNEVVADRALGYSPREGGGFEISVTQLDMVGDGGVFTHLRDLLLWDRNTYQPWVGSAELLALMVAPGILSDGEPIPYASGLIVGAHRGVRKVSHGGAFVGYRAELARFPDQHLSVACLCNRSDANPSSLAQQVADLWLREHLEPQPSQSNAEEETAGTEETEPSREVAADLSPLAGDYACDELDTVLRLTVAEGALRLGYLDPWKPPLGQPLQAASADHFRGGGRSLHFERGPEGSIRGLRMGNGRVRDLLCLKVPATED